MDNLYPYQNKALIVFIKVYPWDDRQTINVDSHTPIGDITVFYKQTGRSMKISEMEDFALFKPLELPGNNLRNNHNISTPDNAAAVAVAVDLTNDKSQRVKLKSSSVLFKKKVRMENDQCLMSYSVINGSYLDLRQVDALEPRVPRWFYKTIVPSNQLESLLREPKQPLPLSRSNSITDIVDSIKANRTLTIGSPSRGNGGISSWQFAVPSQHKRVYDVVHRIECQFPSIVPTDTTLLAQEDRWEAKVNSSEDIHIKRLAMDDSLTQETVKQEYIEFSLRFEKRTALLLGVHASLLVWIEPIHTYFTLCFSENTTVHDAICFIVQYIYPSQQQSSSSSIDSNQFGLYLQESSDTRPLPMQHKQLLTNCRLYNNDRLEDTVFLFKAKQQRKRQTANANTPSTTTTINPLTLSQTTTIETIVFEDDSDDEDEGYNLTVLFPSHQTYRQFHFNPHKTVNEIIQSIVTATTPARPKSSMNNSPLPGTPDGNASPKQSSPTLSSNRHSLTVKPAAVMAAAVAAATAATTPLVEQSSIPSFSRSNTIFENQCESAGFCLYYQKSGSGIWMEGHRSLKSYNLPNEAVVEFKPTPTICKMTLVEGFRSTIKLFCNTQTFIVIYGPYTLISDLRQLLIESCSILRATAKDFESYELFLVKGNNIECINNIESFRSLNIDNHIDMLEFKPSTNSSVMKDLELFVGARIPITLPGESIENRCSCDRIVQGQMKKGTMYLTNYRLIFEALNRSSYDDFGTKDDCDIPITSISKLKMSNNQTEITCKDFRVCIFSLSNPSIWEKVKSRLDSSDITSVFAFANAEPYDPAFDTIYNVEDEFLRLQFPVDKWRITYANKDYTLCPTYPSLFIVPESVSDDDLKKISLFREKGRVPAICWIHKTHKSTITRCSQPRVGIFKSKCNEDEEYLNIITRSNTNSPVLYVMDSRPMANAKANTLLGKGHEDTSLYQNVELQFLGIGNIHVMRDSYKKLYNMIQMPEISSNWLSILDGTQWLEHIYQIINSSNIVVEMVDKKGSSVLTHCSDGWDRTSQLVALSQLLLDPYYRTYRGFQVLIEKEWLSFGHQFTHRCAHVNHEKNDEEYSPIFLMFIDAVWQLTNMFPTTFQFNEKFLIIILESVYNCRYGTFLFNHQRERVLYTKRNGGLASLWTHLNSNVNEYTNYFFIGDPKPIFHNFYLSDIQFWTNYYFRWKENYKPKVVIDESIVKIVEKHRKE